MLAGGRQLRGIPGGDACPRTFLPKLLDYWRQGRFPFDRMLSFYPWPRSPAPLPTRIRSARSSPSC